MSAGISEVDGRALSVADRSRVISESLRQMARVSRFSDAKTVGRASYTIGRSRKRDVVTPALFAILFVLPVLLGTLYYGVIASDRFITEASFAIRPAVEGAEKAAGDAIGQTLGVPKAMIVQDTMIVMDYIVSRPLIEALEAQMPLRAMFSGPGIDDLSRLNPKKPIEKVLHYWEQRVSVSASPSSGIVSLTVNAFSAEESLALTKAILAESERMINGFSLRARQDTLDQAARSLARAEEQVTRARSALRDLRNKEGVLDAQRSADANFKMLSELRGQRIQLVLRQNTLGRDFAPDSRPMQEVAIQIKQIDEATARIERATAAQSDQERKVLSATLTSFETLDNERKNVERYHAGAFAAYERAKILAERQIEFFSPVVEPVLAVSPQAPRRVLSIFIVLASATSAFLIALFARRLLTA